MSYFFKKAAVTMACGALLIGLRSASFVWAHGGSHGSNTRSSAPAEIPNDSRALDDLNLDARTLQPMYGGQVTTTKWHFFEVVYTPQEIRVYVYSPSRRPIQAGGIRGKVVMQVKGDTKPFRYSVKRATDAHGRTYGSVVVDVTRVRDGDMQVAFHLERLPFKEENKAQFAQIFYLTRPPVPVTVVALTDADRPLVERQRVCPVMDAGLSEHGEPIKLMVDDQALFVCCEGCIKDVRKNPQHYLEKAADAVQANRQPPRPQVAVFWASQADDAAIHNQANCPVMDQPLGAHGRPLKVVIDGRPIFVCCEGCIEKVVQGRDFYFRKVADAMVARRNIRPLNQPVAQNEQAPPRRHIAVSYATPADRPAAQGQGTCPVTNQPLGEHGAPIKIAIDGQPVFVCCQGCVGKVEQNPDWYLSEVARGQQPYPYTTYDVGFYQKPAPNVSDSVGSCCSDNKKGSCCQ